MKDEDLERRKIILFDGICNLCTGSVIFILKRERDPVFHFASIQSQVGQELSEWCRLPAGYDRSIIYLDNGSIYLGSEAALMIGKHLVFPWSLLAHTGLLVPRVLRDPIYNLIARSRYRWFGKRDFCMIPTGNLKARFL
jgi:predicted DCC family thiol-disulfide oxidoreductase YuxK